MSGPASLASVRPRPVGSGHLQLGGDFAILGDSLVTGGAQMPSTFGGAWPLWFQALSGGRARVVSFDGRPGKTSEDLQTGVQQVIASGATFCIYGAGTNDVLQGFAFKRTVARISADIATLMQAGVVPVMVTLPPNNTTAYRNAILQRNLWIRRFASAHGLPLLDFYTLLVDPSNSQYLAQYYNEGTHPNAAGYYAMGQLAWNTLGPLIAPGAANLTRLNTDPLNLLNANTCFLADVNADGVPDGWSVFGGTTGYTHSIVTGDTSITGNWAQIAASGLDADRVLSFTSTAGVGAGHKLAACGLQAVTAYTSGSGATTKISWQGVSGAVYPAYHWQQVASGFYYQEIIVPPFATQVTISMIAHAGTVTAKWAQPTIYDLTALGLA